MHSDPVTLILTRDRTGARRDEKSNRVRQAAQRALCQRLLDVKDDDVMTIKTDIEEALQARGINPEAPLVCLHETSDIWSDKRTLVVKVGHENTRGDYLCDLKAFAKAGVRCEKLLLDEVIPVGELHAVVVGYLTPDRPPQASDAKAVGALLRAVHEATLDPNRYEPPTEGHVSFPDDWHAQNIIIHAGVPYLVDLDLWQECPRDEAVKLACDQFLRGLPHTEDDIAAFRRGYGAYDA